MDDMYGPPLPPSFTQSSSSPPKHHDSDEEADFSIGPILPGTSTSTNRHYVKPNFSDKDDKDTNKRDEWMLALPELKKQNQLAQLHGSLPTSFRKSAIEAQDDSWTKDPRTNETRKRESTKPEHDFDKDYDREQEKSAKKSKKDRDRDKKSLLELHEEKLRKERKKKRKEKKDAKPERTPFSRETDLAWNSNQDKKKSKAISNMSMPDSRFHSGSRKYL